MGNFLACTASIGVPLLTKLVTIPFLLHPTRWGGIPWKEPHWAFMGFMTVFLNLLSIMILGTLSGMMTTEQACRKHDILQSFRRSTWLVLGYLVGNALLMIFPFIKVPFLLFGMWLPYAGYLIHGFLVSIVMMFFGAMGNTILRAQIC